MLRTGLTLVLLLASHTIAATFPGWQAMRVIEQEGRPHVIRRGDLDGDGRDELIVVNTRHSRLEIYRWLPEDERKEADPPDVDRPNDLPMAPDFRRDELTLEHLPQNVVVEDLDGDGLDELVILVAPPNRIVIYEQDEAYDWKQARRVDLLAGELAPHSSALLIRRVGEQQFELLISFTEGIQTIRLAPGSRPQWLTPREQRSRDNWWLSDLDADGDDDLIEQSRDADEAIRWFQCAADGHLMPPAVLYEHPVGGASPLRAKSGAQMLLLDGATQGLLRRFTLDWGDQSPVGRRRALAMPDGPAAVWCGLSIENRPALVMADPDGPQLLMYTLGEAGWETQESFPGLSDVRAVGAPQAKPGTLLLWTKDAADLMVSRWDHGRLSYPKPLPATVENEADRKILELSSAGPITWWVQKVGDVLDLYVWEPDQNEPRRTRFEAQWTDKKKKRTIGETAKDVTWLGGDRLLFKQLHARHAELAVHTDGKTVITSPAHLKNARFTDFRLFVIDGTVRVGRLKDGVLQWLGGDLHAADQIMLPQSEKMADYVALTADGGWALQQDGRFLHLMRADDSGIAKVARSIAMFGGSGLTRDPVLGLVLIDHNCVTQLSEGRPHQLKLVDSIDHRIGRPSGVKDATIHRINTADVRAAGRNDLVLFDDRRHQLTVLSEQDGKLTAQISWPVYEDKKYPYADEHSPLIREPRAVVALDVDGDAQQDLAMICHDRILFYIAKADP